MRKLVPLLALTVALVAPNAVAAGTKTYLPGCGGTDKAKVRPSKVVITCGDGAFYVKKITWTHWGRKYAKGHGTAKVNTCDPSCAMGTYKSYKLNLRASRPHHCKAAGKREWHRLKWTFPDKRPKGFDKSQSEKRPCSD